MASCGCTARDRSRVSGATTTWPACPRRMNRTDRDSSRHSNVGSAIALEHVQLVAFTRRLFEDGRICTAEDHDGVGCGTTVASIHDGCPQ